MIESCMAILRSEIKELKRLLDESDLPKDQAARIREYLVQLSEIIKQYE